MPNQFTKQPNEDLDYDFDFSKWMPPGDSLQADLGTSTVIVPAGLIAGAKQHNTTAQIVKQWISGGTDGTTYKITCRITTTLGRTKETEITILVREL